MVAARAVLPLEGSLRLFLWGGCARAHYDGGLLATHGGWADVAGDGECDWGEPHVGRARTPLVHSRALSAGDCRTLALLAAGQEQTVCHRHDGGDVGALCDFLPRHAWRRALFADLVVLLLHAGRLSPQLAGSPSDAEMERSPASALLSPGLRLLLVRPDGGDEFASGALSVFALGGDGCALGVGAANEVAAMADVVLLRDLSDALPFFLSYGLGWRTVPGI